MNHQLHHKESSVRERENINDSHDCNGFKQRNNAPSNDNEENQTDSC